MAHMRLSEGQQFFFLFFYFILFIFFISVPTAVAFEQILT